MDVMVFEKENWQVQANVQSLILISAGGTSNYDYALSGQMLETPILQNSPYLKKMLVALERPLSRCRLIRLSQGEHSLREASFHRFIRKLIYIPLVHFPDTQFYVENMSVTLHHNQPYQLHGSQVHNIVNTHNEDCIYLQIETLYEKGELNAPFLEPHHFESLTPIQFEHFIDVINLSLAESAFDIEKHKLFQEQSTKLVQNWKIIFSRFGKTWEGELSYQDVLLDVVTLCNGIQKYLNNEASYALNILSTMLSMTCHLKSKRHFSRYFFVMNKPLPEIEQCPDFKKPIFIVSAPRAGSTLLFETLSQFPDIWTIGEESHELIEDIQGLHPSAQSFNSNRLNELQATQEVVEQLKKKFVRQLVNRNRVDYLTLKPDDRPKAIRFLEKTPKNALRIPFLKKAFPDALFIYLERDKKENISSLLEGWRSLRFVAYRHLHDYTHRQWSFLLPDGWRQFQNAPLAKIATYQWQSCNETIIEDLHKLSPHDWCHVSYSDLIDSPKKTLTRIAHFAELDKDSNINDLLNRTLPISRLTLSAPSKDKWRKYETELQDNIAGHF